MKQEVKCKKCGLLLKDGIFGEGEPNIAHGIDKNGNKWDELQWWCEKCQEITAKKYNFNKLIK